ncbi:MAG: TylF/MycF/NovP-related O-methyltransferase [Patescibacteria group bacterium]
MKNLLRNITRAIIRRYLTKDHSITREFHPYYDFVDTNNKRFFDITHTEGIRITKTPYSVWRRDRFLNLSFLLEYIRNFGGAYAECGAWRGLSSFVICSTIKHQQPEFLGENYHIVDSFEGLSSPTNADGVINISTNKRFACDIDTVQKNLSMFPKIKYHKGWIPEILSGLPEEKYKFVHIDLDLAAPTIGALDYFMSRMLPGGIIVCDDYGGVIWHGMRAEVDKYCKERKISKILELSTGQLVIFL